MDPITQEQIFMIGMAIGGGAGIAIGVTIAILGTGYLHDRKIRKQQKIPIKGRAIT